MEKTDEILGYIRRAIPDIARKCRVRQEDVLGCMRLLSKDKDE